MRAAVTLSMLGASTLAFAGCSDAADGAQALVECRAERDRILAERNLVVPDRIAEMRAMAEGGEPTPEEMERFAELQAEIESYENRIQTETRRCEDLAREQDA